MQEESPLISGARKLYQGFEKYVGDPSKPAGKQKDTTDYSWHEKMVKEANESHKKSMSDAKLGSTKKSAKKKAKRKTAAKR